MVFVGVLVSVGVGVVERPTLGDLVGVGVPLSVLVGVKVLVEVLVGSGVLDMVLVGVGVGVDFTHSPPTQTPAKTA